MGFIRLLLIFLLIYFIIRFIGRVLFGYVGMRYMKGNSQDASRYRNRKEGDVIVNINTNDKEKRIDKDEGEYVNFEEVRD